MSVFIVDPSKICQIEIYVSDLERSLRFYENALGWCAVPAEIHQVTVLKVPEGSPFGISLIEGGSRSSSERSLVLYFSHEDPQRVLELVVTYGGTRKFGPRKLPGYGTIFQFTDPDGTCFGLFQSTP